MSTALLNASSSTVAVEWYCVTIDDPELAVAASFKRLVTKATKYSALGAVKVSELEMVPSVPPLLETRDGRLPILTLDVFEQSLRSIIQFVWGRFFFYSDRNAAEEAPEQTSLAEAIALTELTICILDNASYVVFTRSFPFACELLAEDWPVEVQKDSLQSILSQQHRP